jgi:HAD superfamily hydrolase (TIGR01509 family)
VKISQALSAGLFVDHIRSKLSQIQAVIFDMDGLLFDTETFIKKAKLDACRAFGFEMPDALYNSMIGQPGPESDLRIQAHFGPDFPFEDYLAAYRGAWAQVLNDGIPLKSGAADLVSHLHGLRMPIGLATSSRRESAEHHLTTSDLRRFFSAVVTRSDVSRGKPHPDLYQKAADELGVAPQHCLALEDSYNGVRAAHAAGCLPIMVPDLLEATDEMQTLCVTVANDLNDVRLLFPAER